MPRVAILNDRYNLHSSARVRQRGVPPTSEVSAACDCAGTADALLPFGSRFRAPHLRDIRRSRAAVLLSDRKPFLPPPWVVRDVYTMEDRASRAVRREEDTMEVSPARLLWMLSDRFGALEAVAHSSIKLSRYVSDDEMSMDLLVAEAVLEFGDDLRAACASVRIPNGDRHVEW